MKSNLFASIHHPFLGSFIDYPSPDDIALTVYFMGCTHRCIGCFNPDFQDFNHKDNYTMRIPFEEFCITLDTYAERFRTNKVVLLGGDPLAGDNCLFTKAILERNLNYDICIYTGYTCDYIQKIDLRNFRYIKCGQYYPELKQESIKTDKYIQFASSNQCLYNSNLKLLSQSGRFNFEEEA